MIKIARKEKQATQAKYLDKISVFRGTEHYTRISANCETAKQKKCCHPLYKTLFIRPDVRLCRVEKRMNHVDKRLLHQFLIS